VAVINASTLQVRPSLFFFITSTKEYQEEVVLALPFAADPQFNHFTGDGHHLYLFVRIKNEQPPKTKAKKKKRTSSQKVGPVASSVF
jgi:hypothetical protein